MTIFTGRPEMKNSILMGLAVLITMSFSLNATAQRKTAKKPAAKTTASKTTLPPLEVRVARDKVSIQRDNVSRFVDKLGPIAVAIETLDESSRSTPLSKSAQDRNDTNKQNVIAAIRNVRAGLSDLESDFRTKPSLQKYLSTVQGITDLAAEAEDSAL